MTTIRYRIWHYARVTLRIYNVAGQAVKTLVDEEQGASPSVHSVKWNGADAQGNQVASGVYFFSSKAGNMVMTKKMVLLR